MDAWIIINAVCIVVNFSLATIPNNELKLWNMVGAVCSALALGMRIVMACG